MKKKGVFLDRDGTINLDKGYVYHPKDFKPLPGALEGMRHLQDAGYQLVIVTNQSGIARGYYSTAQFMQLCEYMDKLFLRHGIKKIPLYYCPHLDAGCACRKPRTGLFYQAARDLALDFSTSWAVGDRERDLSICGREPVRGILLSHTLREGYMVCKNLLEAAKFITAS